MHQVQSPFVIYAGPFAFPHGGAAARRILGNAQTLTAAGCTVEVWSGQMAPAATAPHAPPARRQRGHGEDTLPLAATPTPVPQPSPPCSQIPVRSLGERTAERLPHALKHLAYLGMGRGLVRALRAETRPIAAVILYSGYTPYLQRLLAWSRRSGVPLAFDAVEWYDPPRPTRFLTDPYYWNIEYAMRRLAPQCRNAITISKKLEQHFQSAGCRTVRIPPTLDVLTVPTGDGVRADHAPIVLSYTGSPGHKERLGTLLAALICLGPAAAHVRLKIAGVSEAELLALPDVASLGIKSLPPHVEVLGRVDHDAAMTLTRSADFSVLLRPQMRFANAGFPTKVVESLASGTPLFGNLTSDLGDHLRDGDNAVLVRSPTVDAVVDGLKRLIALPRPALSAMRNAAREEATRAFDYRAYVPAVDHFVQHLRKSH